MGRRQNLVLALLASACSQTCGQAAPSVQTMATSSAPKRSVPRDAGSHENATITQDAAGEQVVDSTPRSPDGGVEEDVPEASLDAESATDPMDRLPLDADPVVALMKKCKILTAGEFRVRRGGDAYADCIRGCLLTASCDDLSKVFCGWSEIRIANCQFSCPTVPEDSTTTCGDGTRLWPTMRCDGLYDCYDLSDEEGCESFPCGEPAEGVPAETVALAVRCNGFADCTNSADEVGCAQLHCAP